MNSAQNDDAALPKLAVVVSSFDGMDDLWEPFWTLFSRFWPDCKYDRYLISNRKSFDHPGVKTILVGDDQGWATNLRIALQRLPDEQILYLQEDYLINAPVSSERLEQLSKIHKAAGAICTYLYPRNEYSTPFTHNQQVSVVEMAIPFRVSLQAAIWERVALLNLLQDGESQWRFEYRASEEWHGLILTERLGPVDSWRWAIPYFTTAVVRGKWHPGALELCREHGIKIDPKRRKVHRLWKLRHAAARVKWYFRFGPAPKTTEK